MDEPSGSSIFEFAGAPDIIVANKTTENRNMIADDHMDDLGVAVPILI